MRSSHRHESGTNLARVKDYNEVVVLDLVRGRGELTRPAIAEAPSPPPAAPSGGCA